jgi:aminoglycoside phosphotransferase family enzyme/predicted kinase
MPAGAAEICETHISVLVFIGDRAYKLKKPVRFGFLDFSTREVREEMCHREVELNRRLAPDVYLGVADVIGPDGTPADHLVVMRRMPGDRRLASLVTAGDPRVPGALRDLARLLAEFHARAERGAEIDAACTVEAVRGLWRDNTAEMRPLADAVFEATDLDRVDEMARGFLDGRVGLFDERIRSSRCVDGHGDLLAGDVFCLDDGPRVLDTIEFDDRLRFGDVVADVAFLAMDLERLRHPELGARFRADYEEFAGEQFPPGLWHHAVAYRAQVRAKVAALRAVQELGPGIGTGAGQEEVQEARRLLALCLDHLERAGPRLVLVGGLPGTGKTTVSIGVADALEAVHLRSDVVRKHAAGLAPVEQAVAAPGAGIYTEASTERTYEELLAEAQRHLRSGWSVVVDASWGDEGHRRAARRLARETSAKLVELRCEVDPGVAATRVSRRLAERSDASDATPEVVTYLADRADPWPQARTLDAARPVPEVIAAALRFTRD